MNYKKTNEPDLEDDILSNDAFRYPFRGKNFSATRQRGNVMIRSFDDKGMTKRQAYDEVFKHINKQRRTKKNKNAGSKSKKQTGTMTKPKAAKKKEHLGRRGCSWITTTENNGEQYTTNISTNTKP
jgi:hypothetical protein